MAVQLSVLRYPGWSLSNIWEVPKRVLGYIAKQIQVRPEEFALYAQREATRKEHLEEIRQLYGYRNFTIREYRVLSQFILEAAMENGKTDYLIRLAIDELRKQKIMLPAMTTIERFVWESRCRADEKIFKSITSSISEAQSQRLDETFFPGSIFKGRSTSGIYTGHEITD